MELFTSVSFSDQASSIDHSTKLLAMGSCFAEHMGDYLEKNRFDIVLNPFGISYHPLVIHRQILRLLSNEPYQAHELEHYNQRWHSWDHHGRFSQSEKQGTLDRMNTALSTAQLQLEKLDHLLITFGTAYGYSLKNRKGLVANCHKYPAVHFSKQLSETEEMFTAWKELIYLLKSQNKQLKITLTVSPVRHKKEGLIDNNRSKARCLILAEKLSEEFLDCHYFPAYEIVIDELRDYRFFKSDLVHPSDQAIQFIWEKFEAHYFGEKTKEINKHISGFQSAADHKPFLPDSDAHQFFLKKELNKIVVFQDQHPYIDVSDLKAIFEKGII